ENTVSGSALKTAAADPLASPRAAIASVVMVGHYEVKYGEETVTLGDDELFYVTGNKTNGYKYYTEDAMLAFFLGNTIALASDADGKELTADEQAKYLTLIHPSADVRGNLVIDSRYVTLQLTEEAIGNVYAKVGDDYAPVTEENIVLVNQRVMSGAGTAYGFHGGKAYFNVPIQHLGYYRTGNKNATVAGGANSADFEWENVQSGDFGIVRNHIYTINVSKIEGLGNAIPNPDEPIVPPTDPEDYYIGARIVVLNWAVVPTQDVEL
ncbi:MAG: Mfa1 fimbrilin C-terminal domain-containing protein, partial [Prevotellaceae bacterium]|nr:Mfa1 fimbrilin C-terminal domain-containing protein [Prevotellaceae bacterium]